MSAENDQIKSLPLRIIDSGEPARIYLPLENDGKPIRLGSGRNAFVFLGLKVNNRRATTNQDFFAIKCLKQDEDTEQNQISQSRFLEELDNTSRYGTGSFIKFIGSGVLGSSNVQDKDIVVAPRDWETWKLYIPQLDEGYLANYNSENRTEFKLADFLNDSPEFETIIREYHLQGPFYVMEFCSASLYDLLEKDISWLEQIPYLYQELYLPKGKLSHVNKLEAAAERMLVGDGSQANEKKISIKDVKEKYFKPDTVFRGKTGYEILHSFKRDDISNRVRNFAVLDLFEKIVATVQDLHSKPNENQEALAHRDLKPGNLFIHHTDSNPEQIEIKIGDLGFVTSLTKLGEGEFTLVRSFQNPTSTAPGSQFFRAPEQAELPIEVKLTVDAQDPRKVTFKNNKIRKVQEGDTLIVGDYNVLNETDKADKENKFRFYCTIKEVYREEDAQRRKVNITGFRLDKDLQANAKDVVAHVVKATGFHTDGYSLGAILYDLASGGRDPETFYIHCLSRFVKELCGVTYSVDEVVEALYPVDSWDSVLKAKASLESEKSSVDKESVQSEAVLQHYRGYQYNNNSYSLISFDFHVKENKEDRRVYERNIEELKKAPTVESAVTQFLSSPIIANKVKSASSQQSQSVDLHLTTQEKWELLQLVWQSDQVDNFFKMLLKSSLDQKVANSVKTETAANGTGTGISFDKRWRFSKLVQSENDIDQLINRVLQTQFSQEGVVSQEKLEERLRNFKFRNFHIVEEYLSDTRGEPIPRDILHLIVSCMLRDVPGSYYVNQPKENGYNNENNSLAVNRVLARTKYLLGEQRNLPPDEDFPRDLRGNLLFMLRALAPLTEKD